MYSVHCRKVRDLRSCAAHPEPVDSSALAVRLETAGLSVPAARLEPVDLSALAVHLETVGSG